MKTAQVPFPFFDLDAMCEDANKRLAETINRSAGQHIRAIKQHSTQNTKPDFDDYGVSWPDFAGVAA